MNEEKKLGLMMPSIEEIEKSKTQGTWVEIPGFGDPPVKFKIKFMSQKELNERRKLWTVKTFDKKTHLPVTYEDEDKKLKANIDMITDCVTDWEGVGDTNGVLKFSRDSFENLLNVYALTKVDYRDDEGDQMSLTAFLVKVMTDNSFHFGEKKN